MAIEDLHSGKHRSQHTPERSTNSRGANPILLRPADSIGQMPRPQPENFYFTQEIALWLRLTARTVRNWIAIGVKSRPGEPLNRLAAQRIGPRRLAVFERDLVEFLRHNEYGVPSINDLREIARRRQKT